MEPLIKSTADCVAGKIRMDARRATKVVARTTKPRRARVASHLRSCAAERASARLRGRTYPRLHAPASTTQTPHFTATQRDGCRDPAAEGLCAGAATRAPRLTVFAAATCASSRTTLRETESGAPCPGGLLCRSACQGEWPLAASRFAHALAKRGAGAP